MNFRNTFYRSLCFLMAAISIDAAANQVPIRLPTNQIVQLDYAGIEYWNDTSPNGSPNFVVDTGDSFQGLLLIDRITGKRTGRDFSNQLYEKELIIHFKFCVVDGPDENDHLEFDICDGFFRFYVREEPNEPLVLDPMTYSEEDMVALAETGSSWMEILPDTLFQSVNDPDPNPISGTTGTLNRAWSYISTNNTGYDLLSRRIRSRLGENGDHLWRKYHRPDLKAPFTFDNHVNLPPNFDAFSPRVYFDIFGEIRVRAKRAD